MHFAYPPRKGSNPPPFRPRSSQLPLLRRTRLRSIAFFFILILGGLWLLTRPKHTAAPPYREHVPSGTPHVVMVTVVDPSLYSTAYLKKIQENREQYAAKHGYQSMVAKVSDYENGDSPASWTNVIAIRHALTLYPDCKYVWFLDQDALIMDLDKSLDEAVLEPTKLNAMMIRDVSVVPPDSIIKTFARLKPDEASIILTQDAKGLVTDSIIIRNGEWAKFFAETWMDPLYKSYNFEKIERHALEHIVQWHPTILSKLALVPQRTIASYRKAKKHKEQSAYQEGDFLVLLNECPATGTNSCESQAEPLLQKIASKRSAFV